MKIGVLMKTEPHHSTLTSLAMLKVHIDAKRDYLDYLVPFVMQILAASPDDPATDHSVKESLRTEFGLVLPDRGVQLVLRRLAKKGFLRLEHGIYRSVREFPATDIPKKRADANRQIDNVVNAICEFVRIKAEIEWTTDDATHALLNLISGFSIDCLRNYTRGTTLPDMKPTDQGTAYLVGTFIRETREKNPPLFADVMVIVKGHMLANALLCPDLDSLKRSFERVTFYFDTPLVLMILGLHGETDQDTALELIGLLKRLSGKLAVFDHTVHETQSVIDWAANHRDDQNVNSPIVRTMRRESKTRSDLLLLKGLLPSELRKHGIANKPTPKCVNDYQIDLLELQNALDQDLQYSNPRAKEFDADSIRSIYTLREGMAPCRLEDAKAILVTSNPALANVASCFGRQYECAREVSTVITDYSLANIAWLKAPLGAPELPEKELLGVCYAVLEPSSELWEKFLGEVDRLKKKGEITAEEHEILRSSLAARDELMGITLGDEAALTVRTIGEILTRVKDDLVREQTQIIETEKSLHANTKQEATDLRLSNSEMRKTNFWFCQRIGHLTSRSMLIIVALILLIIPVYSWYKDPDAPATFFLAVLSGVIFVLNYFGMLFGLSVQNITDWIGNNVEARLCRSLNVAEPTE